MMNSIALLMGALLGMGCAVETPGSATAPTTQPAAEVRIVRMSGAVPIGRLRGGDDHDVNLTQIIHESTDDDLYFGQAEQYDANGDVSATQAVVVAKVNGGWQALSLKDDRLKNAEWQLVASGPADKEIWGVLDDSLEHQGKFILLVHSTDAGKTWAITSVAKPFQMGDYDSFCMARSGRGRLTVYVSGDKKHRSRTGFYHVRTTDGGKTWSAPEHEPDSLSPADDVPDDEDPAPLKDQPLQSVNASN